MQLVTCPAADPGVASSVSPRSDTFAEIDHEIISTAILLLSGVSRSDNFNFEIINLPFPDGDVPRSHSYGGYISQLIRFAKLCSNVDVFSNRNKFLTSMLLKQDYR